MLTQVDDPMYHGEYQPNQSEFIATSIFGIFLFFGILSVSGLILLSNWKRLCATTRIFYISMVMMAAFDLPRYFSLAVEKDYISVEVYAMHIISGIFYFICLSTVGFSFVYILELGSYMSLLYSKWGLAIAIAIHSAIDLTAFGLCLRSSSLASFFSSFYYRVFITFDITQNLLYSCVLAGFGVKIIYRFRNLGRCSTDVVQRKVFEGVVRKVTIVLSFLCSFSFIRLVLLGVKTSSLQNIENEELVTTPIFPLYGFIWFLLSDFLPRGGNSIILMYLIYAQPQAETQSQEMHAAERATAMSATLDECFRGDDIESPTDTYTSNNRNNQSKGPIAGAVAGARNGSRKGLIATSFTKKAFNHTEAHLSPDPFGYNIDLEDIDAEGLQGEREGEDEDKGEECDGLEEGGRSGVSAMAVAVAVTHMGRSGRGLLSGRKYVSTSGNGSDTGNKQGRVNANTTTNTATTATAATTNTKATTTNKKSNLAQNMKMKTSTV